MPSKASDVWVDPNGIQHAEDAYDILEKLIIGTEESQKLSLAPGGESLEWKGTGGAEAKSVAQRDLAGRQKGDPQNDADLVGLGWSKLSGAESKSPFNPHPISGLGMWLARGR